MERETGVEPATSTLARSHSTTELLPLKELEALYRAENAGSIVPVASLRTAYMASLPSNTSAPTTRHSPRGRARGFSIHPLLSLRSKPLTCLRFHQMLLLLLIATRRVAGLAAFRSTHCCRCAPTAYMPSLALMVLSYCVPIAAYSGADGLFVLGSQ